MTAEELLTQLQSLPNMRGEFTADGPRIVWSYRMLDAGDVKESSREASDAYQQDRESVTLPAGWEWRDFENDHDSAWATIGVVSDVAELLK